MSRAVSPAWLAVRGKAALNLAQGSEEQCCMWAACRLTAEMLQSRGKEKRMCRGGGINPREEERGADGTKDNRSYRSHQIYLLLLGTNT